MIIISLSCQMGNQMFQYAFAQATAKRLRTFFLPYQSNYYYPFKLGYFRLDWFTRFVFSNDKINKQYKRICRKLIKHVAKQHVSPDDWTTIDTFPNFAYYDAFFQSDSYFSSIQKKLNIHFTIKKRYQKEFEQKYELFFRENKVIVVHIRRTDYKEVEFEGLGGQGVDLPIAYYEKSLDTIKNRDDYRIIFISDDIESVKEDFSHYKNAHFETYQAIVDFQLIQHADISIIANSTFAWWAAYLSKKENSITYAPMYWLGFKVKKEFPIGITTSKFNWIEF